jgi:ribonuclease HI
MTSYYVVHKGKIPGIYKTWKDCKEQINNYEGAIFKKFTNKLDAEKFLKQGFGENHKPKCVVRKKNEDIRNEERVEKELQDSENKIFIYTDGSCIKLKNNLSKAGYGIYIPIKNIKVAILRR